MSKTDINIRTAVSSAPKGLVSLLAEWSQCQRRVTQSPTEGQRGKHTLFNSSLKTRSSEDLGAIMACGAHDF